MRAGPDGVGVRAEPARGDQAHGGELAEILDPLVVVVAGRDDVDQVGELAGQLVVAEEVGAAERGGLEADQAGLGHSGASVAASASAVWACASARSRQKVI